MTLLDRYNRFSSHIVIPSRDLGLVKYVTYGTQRYLRSQILEGIEDGIHDFTVLKPRQVGASTEMWSFDLFWLIYHPGLQGAYIAQDEKALIYGVDNLRQMQSSLPTQLTPSIRISNRNLLAWNKTFNGKHGGSRLIYLHAGKGGGGLGRSRGLSFGHFTELAFWNDPDDVHALRASLSKSHPRRAFVWESTANGFNWFFDMWKVANKAVTQRAIFIPWWRHELYSASTMPRVMAGYWDGKLTSEEKAWQRVISRAWNVTLTPEQWAWYRWQLAEEMHSDEIMMHQEYPTLPEHAFQASGQSFMGTAAIVRLREFVHAAETPEWYRYEFGQFIESTKVVSTSEKMAQLTVWEPPRPNTFYVIAADPAFAASPESDNAVVSVWRSEKQGLVQVASFASNEVGPQSLAWVIAHLAGHYQIPHLILEVNGPGMATLQELQQAERWGHGTSRYAQLQDVLGNIRHYIYRRPDTMSRGGFYHWKTSGSNRSWLFTRLREHILRGAIVMRDPELIEELNSVRQDGDKFDAPSHTRDDRVIAAALAVECWASNVEPIMAFMPDPSQVASESGLPDLSTLPPVEPKDLPTIADFFRRLNAPVPR